MTKFAIIDNGVVTQIFDAGDLIPGVDILTPETVAIDLTGVKPSPSSGWLAENNGSNWLFSKPAVAPLTDDQLIAAAQAQRSTLLANANDQTLGMTDAFVAGMLTADEELVYRAWAAYKLSLSKIDKQPGYPSDIDWPVSPGHTS